MVNFISSVITAFIIYLFAGLLVWMCWNPLIPELFGIRAINYWEAVTLSVLTNVLFNISDPSKDAD